MIKKLGKPRTTAAGLVDAENLTAAATVIVDKINELIDAYNSHTHNHYQVVEDTANAVLTSPPVKSERQDNE